MNTPPDPTQALGASLRRRLQPEALRRFIRGRPNGPKLHEQRPGEVTTPAAAPDEQRPAPGAERAARRGRRGMSARSASLGALAAGGLGLVLGVVGAGRLAKDVRASPPEPAPPAGQAAAPAGPVSPPAAERLPRGALGAPPIGGPTGQVYLVRIGTPGEMRFIGLSEGEYDMGSPDGAGSEHEHPQRRVRVSGFALGQSEVTQAQWAAVVQAAWDVGDPDGISLRKGGSHFVGRARPVEQVNWCDAARFANALSRLEGLHPAYAVGQDCEKGGLVARGPSATGFRLPTEAEWEYAARAGTVTAYATGDSEAELASAGWYSGNSGDETHVVCTAGVKPWGLCDMQGNVAEWTWDWADRYDPGEVVDPIGPIHAAYRSARGASCYNGPDFARSAYRLWFYPRDSYEVLGFRLVLPVAAAGP